MESRGTIFEVLLKGARALAKKEAVAQPAVPIGGPRSKRCRSVGGGVEPVLGPCRKRRGSVGGSGVEPKPVCEPVGGCSLEPDLHHNSCESVGGCSVEPEPCPDQCESAASSKMSVMLLKEKVHMLKTEPKSLDISSIVHCLDEKEGFPFLFMCLAFELISNEPQRNMITRIACNLLRTAMSSSQPQKDVLATLCLSTYKLVPAYEGGGADQLGIGEHNIVKALAEAYGWPEKEVRNRYVSLGDLGLVAQQARSSQSTLFKPKPLTVSHVYDRFLKIAEVSGKGSRVMKNNIIKQLLAASRDCESKYLIRLLLPKQGLRIGCLETTFLDALGQASVFLEKNDQLSPEEGAEIVKGAYAVLPVYKRVIEALFTTGVRNLRQACSLSVGIPIEPMLSKPIGSLHDVGKKLGGLPYTCEYKYDGERAQIHYLEDGRVEIYSRNLERSTEKYPDVADSVRRLKACTVSSFVLDCEIVAYDRGNKKILSFQKLSSRGRKGVQIDDIKVDACIFAFDLLYLNGDSLVEEQLYTRRSLMYASFKEDAGYLQFATAVTSEDPKHLQKFLEESVSASCEGLIIKPIFWGSKYEPGKRNWLKLKKDFIDSLWDSLDLVPIGAYYGCGKRNGVYGTFLLACYNPDTEEFQTICKTGTGLSEQLLDDLHGNLKSKVITNAKPYYKYNADKVQPDVWVEPSEVWEVRAGGLTISPAYSAAIGFVSPDKGLSLRNPTLLRVRDDKKPKQATTANQVADMYVQVQQWKKPSCSTEGGASSDNEPVGIKVEA